MSKRIQVQKTYKNYVGGKFERTESGRFYPVENADGDFLANLCLSSRKDLRNAVVAARGAQDSWAARSAFNRGQILYRTAEMLEGRSSQFVDEIVESLGTPAKEAKEEVTLSIDLLIYYAGWTDKISQIFGGVNPVASSHFNFSVPEAMGVVGVIAPEAKPLLGLLAAALPAITGGNTVVAVPWMEKAIPAMTFAEILETSDFPPGVFNLISGNRHEILPHMTQHMDVNGIIHANRSASKEEISELQATSATNLKRLSLPKEENMMDGDPYLILDNMEIKTTWHPIGI